MDGLSRPGTLLLTRADVAALLDLDTCIAAVESAFRAHGTGAAGRPGILGVHAADGGFHTKAGILAIDGRAYFAVKTNSNFRHNPARHGLPTIQGVLALCDATDGRFLALMDAIEITALRTAAATAVAARWLAREDAAVATIAGCGVQGRVQLRALMRVRTLRRVLAFDRDGAAARAFAQDASSGLGLEAAVADDLAAAAANSDVIVTCTTSAQPILGRDAVRPGTFVAGVGADAEDKWELAPDLLAAGTLVVDVLEQAATIGDLHHALAAGVLGRDRVHAELGEVVAGMKPGRVAGDEITIFDSTGMALQDVAAAAAVYERALTAGRGTSVDLARSEG